MHIEKPLVTVTIDARGRLIEARIASLSRPGIEYTLLRGPGGTWQHEGTPCPGFEWHGRCYHVDAAKNVSP